MCWRGVMQGEVSAISRGLASPNDSVLITSLWSCFKLLRASHERWCCLVSMLTCPKLHLLCQTVLSWNVFPICFWMCWAFKSEQMWSITAVLSHKIIQLLKKCIHNWFVIVALVSEELLKRNCRGKITVCWRTVDIIIILLKLLTWVRNFNRVCLRFHLSRTATTQRVALENL